VCTKQNDRLSFGNKKDYQGKGVRSGINARKVTNYTNALEKGSTKITKCWTPEGKETCRG
jgi:hypothetical protein